MFQTASKDCAIQLVAARVGWESMTLIKVPSFVDVPFVPSEGLSIYVACRGLVSDLCPARKACVNRARSQSTRAADHQCSCTQWADLYDARLQWLADAHDALDARAAARR